MPRLIAPPEEDAVIDLDDLVDWCESHAFDPSCEDGLAAAAPMLRALSRNRHFLADAAIAELKTRCADQRRINPYSAQVMLLRPPAGKYVLRAAFWPAMNDHVVRMSGTAPFLYHVPHDHGFDFLTVGYLGPGYGSDYYDYDGDVAGAAGEALALRFVERSHLSEGRMLLYRANRDIHAQLPPEAMSVSLNILASGPGQGWRRQYRFDTAGGVIAECMTVASAQMLLELAAGCGNGNALDLAEAFSRAHPQDAMRLTAWRALETGMGAEDRRRHWERGARSSSALIRRASENALRSIHYGDEMACFPIAATVG
ncbi:transposase [Sphingobium sp.]|uniref:transposase n=1 Tax=Sphingobium sp. TaxID=1912891 RepID=UPI002B7838A9|nr:transposase [Sphingobium sp.]HUD93177.1 transposase [Sphingobium sp.]